MGPEIHWNCSESERGDRDVAQGLDSGAVHSSVGSRGAILHSTSCNELRAHASLSHCIDVGTLLSCRSEFSCRGSSATAVLRSQRVHEAGVVDLLTSAYRRTGSSTC